MISKVTSLGSPWTVIVKPTDTCWIIVRSKITSSGNTWTVFGNRIDMSGGPWTVWDVTDASSVSTGVPKSRHPADCQHVGYHSRTVHGPSEFGKPSRCYLGSLGAWGSLGYPWDPRTRESDLQMYYASSVTRHLEVLKRGFEGATS
jgi:hypothetical protein